MQLRNKYKSRPFHHNKWNVSVRSRSNVQGEIAAESDVVDEKCNKFVCRFVVGVSFQAIPAPRPCHCHEIGPLVTDGRRRLKFIATRPIASVLASAIGTPSIVDDDAIFDGGFVIEPGEKVGRFQLGAVEKNAIVAVDQIGFVFDGQVFEFLKKNFVYVRLLAFVRFRSVFVVPRKKGIAPFNVTV